MEKPFDIFSGEWIGTEHENEIKKELETGDCAKVIVDSQFYDKSLNGNKFPRLYGMVGKVIEIDTSDE